MIHCLTTACATHRKRNFVIENFQAEFDAVVPPGSSQIIKCWQSRESSCGSKSSLYCLLGVSKNENNALMNSTFEVVLQNFAANLDNSAVVRFEIVTLEDTFSRHFTSLECFRTADAISFMQERCESQQVVLIRCYGMGLKDDHLIFEEQRYMFLSLLESQCVQDVDHAIGDVCAALKFRPTFVCCHYTPLIDQVVIRILFETLKKIKDFFQSTEGVNTTETWAVRSDQDIVKLLRALQYRLEVGDYLVLLNPTLHPEEKICHRISKGTSQITSSPVDASYDDFVLGARSTIYNSVGSPHCYLISNDEGVWIDPVELTYLNGSLIVGKSKLERNDRVAIGNDVLLRFVSVSRSSSTKYIPEIIEWWSNGCQEFCTGSQSAKEPTTNSEKFEDKCVILEELLKSRAVGATLVLTNPPESHSETNVWSLENIDEGLSIGPNNASIVFPQLKSRATIERDGEGYIITAGGTSKRLYHSSRFIVGEFLFLINDTSCKKVRVGAKVSCSPKRETAQQSLTISSQQLVELRNGLYDLQWSIALLFDFAFPTPQSGKNDAHTKRRKKISSDATVASDQFSVRSMLSLFEELSESIKMIGSKLADEINDPSSDLSPIPALQRLLHERNRTIEQLLLGTDSTAVVDWNHLQRVVTSEGQKLVRIAQLEEDLSRASAVGDVLPSSVDPMSNGAKGLTCELLQSIKNSVVVFTPTVARRLASTLDSLARAPNIRQQWDRYCKELDAFIELSGGVHNVQTHKQQSLLLALLDVIATYEVGCRQGWIVQGDRLYVERRAPLWKILAETCSTTLLSQRLLRPPSPLRRIDDTHTSNSRTSSLARESTARSPLVRESSLDSRSQNSRSSARANTSPVARAYSANSRPASSSPAPVPRGRQGTAPRVMRSPPTLRKSPASVISRTPRTPSASSTPRAATKIKPGMIQKQRPEEMSKSLTRQQLMNIHFTSIAKKY
jgi:hypothetical protein